MSNITDVSVLSPSIEVEGNLPVVQCLQCHQSLKEAAGQTQTLLDLMKEVKKLKAIVIRSESIPASMSNRVPRSERQNSNSADARPNFGRQKKMKVGMSPQSKLAKLNRLRLATASDSRAKPAVLETSSTIDKEQQPAAATSKCNDNEQPEATPSTSHDNKQESTSPSTSNDNEQNPAPVASTSTSSTPPAGTSSQDEE